MNRLIPAYTWHGQLMDRLQAERLTDGDIVILNPDNGPCSIQDPAAANVTKGIYYAASLGAQAIGYVHLAYGDRRIEDVIDDIVAWGRLGVLDVFYDECDQYWTSATLRRLTALLYQPKHPHAIRSVFNMGTRPNNLSVAPYASLVVTYEGRGLPPAGRRPEWQAALAYDLEEPLNGADWTWGYTTKDGMPNPWDGIPT